MDFELNDDQKAFQQAAKQFAETELTPNAAQWDADAFFPVDVIRKAGELGFCSIYAPESAGGMGLSRLDAHLIFEQLSYGCTATAAYITIHNMCTWMVTTFGSEELVQRWGALLCTGEKLASYCLTEPNAGSDAASLKTSAQLHGDHYVLNGSKCFISGAGSTDVLVVMARTGGPGAKGISCFLVEAGSDGISYGRKEDKMGWNCQPTRTISFDNVRVPKANFVGGEGDGFKFAMKGLDGGRINIATCSLGTAQAALDAAQRYMLERKQFGQSLAEFQGLQFKLADMLTRLVAARQMVRLAAVKLDHNDSEATVYSAMAKRFATDVGFSVCNDALQIHGGYGYIKEYPLERHVRDTRVHQILEGTNEVMRMIIARRALMEGATEVIQ
ncbi:acyl-CoA dehydrogenase family protein [Ketobacter alkanivorans]|uniref:Acyl-CoA dehydrogenase n=1 Tax=Ketobacter alkanivorans TaxID=1917421 RepID=A0A2K9LJX9_9GAMM|nr:acyl-CoA dehydrogenase family protein [Ketobacter alkanivorans]AUM11805.1 acyl-CoA dehydrogenase [Ketobacter alkanivorans]